MLHKFIFFHPRVNNIIFAVDPADDIKIVINRLGDPKAWSTSGIILNGDTSPVFFGKYFALIAYGGPEIYKKIGFSVNILSAGGIGIGRRRDFYFFGMFDISKIDIVDGFAKVSFTFPEPESGSKSVRIQ